MNVPTPRVILNPAVPPLGAHTMIGSILAHERSLHALSGFAELACRLDNPRMRTLSVADLGQIILDRVCDRAQQFALVHAFGLDGEKPMTYREIADHLGTTPNQAHYHMHLALRIVRHEALEVWARHDGETVDTFSWR